MCFVSIDFIQVWILECSASSVSSLRCQYDFHILRSLSVAFRRWISYVILLSCSSRVWISSFFMRWSLISLWHASIVRKYIAVVSQFLFLAAAISLRSNPYSLCATKNSCKVHSSNSSVKIFIYNFSSFKVYSNYFFRYRRCHAASWS